jgi:nucleoside-diphosphate-sugar epimerase
MYAHTTAVADSFSPVGLLRDEDVMTVTGGMGFVGRHLVQALCRLGKQVTVIDVVGQNHGYLPPNARFVQADLRHYDTVCAALAGARTVFHLAGNSSGSVSVRRPQFDFETNALGTANVANAAAAAGVQRLVYLSSAIVYGVPQSAPITESHPTLPFLPYGASKLSGELVVRSLHETLGLRATIGRAFVLYGPGENPQVAGGEVSQFLRWQLNGRPIQVVGDLDAKTRDFLHVADLCHALLILADRGDHGQVYNLGSGTEVSMRTLAHAVGAVTGRAPALDADPAVLDDSFRLVADTSRLRALGFRPQVELNEGLRDLASVLGDRPELPSCPAVFRRFPSGPSSGAAAAGLIGVPAPRLAGDLVKAGE